MIRITTLLWVALLIVAGGTVMHVSYRVRQVEHHRAEIARDMKQQQEAIRILSAEWNTLSDPRRVDDLAHRYLTLQSTPIQRVVALDIVPFKPADDVRLAAVAAPAKTKPVIAPKAPAPRPEILAKATRPDDAPRQAAIVRTEIRPTIAAPAADDGVGLILARLERRE